MRLCRKFYRNRPGGKPHARRGVDNDAWILEDSAMQENSSRALIVSRSAAERRERNTAPRSRRTKDGQYDASEIDFSVRHNIFTLFGSFKESVASC